VIQDSITAFPWMALARHPAFRAAVQRNAEQILAMKDAMTPTERWLTADLGRTAILNRTLTARARAGEVTVNALLAATRHRNTSSDGRVLQVVRRAQAIGWIDATPGSGDWKARPLIVGRGMIEAWRARALVEVDAASLVWPEIGPALDSLRHDERLRAFLARLHDFDAMPPESRGPPNPGIRLFLQRDCGLLMLYDLISRQAPDRTRLLESAPVSRLALSRRHRVSRSHAGALLDDAARAGFLSFPSRNRIAFSTALSEEAERHFALTFHVIGSSALAAMGTTMTGPAASDPL
jgi:hypothetical protein